MAHRYSLILRNPDSSNSFPPKKYRFPDLKDFFLCLSDALPYLSIGTTTIKENTSIHGFFVK